MEFFPFLFISILFIFFGVALGFFSPKKKIWWYGYRTPQSMRTDESYLYANKLSGKIMLALGLLILVVAYFFKSSFTPALIIIGIVFLFAFTEWKLYRFLKNLD